MKASYRQTKRRRPRHGYIRPKKISWDERVAEAWLCRRNSWNADIFTGKTLTGSRRASGAFRVLNGLPLLLQWKPMVGAFRVARWARFGNAVFQLRNAFYLAEKWGVKRIEFAEPHPFFRGDRAGAIELSWDMKAKRAIAPTLEGLFFQIDAFQTSPSQQDQAGIFATYLRPLVSPEIGAPDPRVDDDDLVLHFRAGDIFRSERPPHSGYGQPPLAYYLSAVEREQPKRVWIVFEDRSNPCVEAAEAALRERGITVVTQSGTLAGDIRVLLSARRIVAGRGSFVHMIAHLSERLRKIYFFERSGGRSVGSHGVDVILGTDAGGEFKAALLSNNWTGSAEQRALLLSYPAEHLRFRPAK